MGLKGVDLDRFGESKSLMVKAAKTEIADRGGGRGGRVEGWRG